MFRLQKGFKTVIGIPLQAKGYLKRYKTLFFFTLQRDSTMAKMLAKCNIWNSKCEVGQVVG